MTANIRQAFPEKDPAEIARLIRGAWQNLGRTAAEFPHLLRLRDTDWDTRVELVGAEYVAELRNRGQPAVFFSGHFGNWEVIPIAAARLGVPVTVVYAPLKNPVIDGMLLRYRRMLGCELVPKSAGGTRNLVRAMKEGRSLGLLVDRRRRGGALVPFFGTDAWTTTAPARLAVRFACPLIPIRVERLPGTRFRVTLYPPLETAGESSETKVIDLTRQMNAAIESWVREHPDQWWCDTKRWPKKTHSAGSR